MNKNKSFDFVIRKKLNELPSIPSYGAWETFQEKWIEKKSDQITLSDQDFDKNIKNKVSSVQKSHQIQHWEKLKYRLETIDTFRRKIYINKIKELIAVFLFLITFMNVTNHFFIFPENNEVLYACNTALNYDIALTETDNQYSIRTNKQSAEILNSGLEEKGSINDVGKNLKKSGVKEIKTLPVYSKNIHPLSQKNNQFVLASNYKLVTEKNKEQEPPKITSITNEPYSVFASIIPMTLTGSKKIRKETRIGFYFSHIRNFILTPYDKVYAIPRFENSTSAQGYGISLGKTLGNIEIESGLEYTNFQYSPILIKEAFGASADVYFETSLKKIKFNFLKVPVRFKYFAYDNRGWRIYALAGTSFNVISEAEYEIEESVVKGKPTNFNRFSNDGPRLEEKPFTPGFLDSGKLKGNYYLDLQLGLGLEKKITSGMHVYLQPSLYSFLKSDGIGIGPNNDKVNSLHLQTGFKFTL
jgi:hypothetical protein